MHSSPKGLPLEVDVHTVKAMLDSGEPFLLLDCREASECALVKIEKSTHIPMHETSERVGQLKPHQQSRVVVYCHHGGRSLQVTHWLRDQGFDKAQSMAGGIDQWSVTIDPSKPRY